MAETLIIQPTTAEVLNDKLNSDERPILINVLSPESYLARRIPGSINIPLEHVDRIDSIVPDKDQDIVVYCANTSCDASPAFANKLIEKGYSKVWDFEDGFEGWAEEGYRLIGHETE